MIKNERIRVVGKSGIQIMQEGGGRLLPLPLLLEENRVARLKRTRDARLWRFCNSKAADLRAPRTRLELVGLRSSRARIKVERRDNERPEEAELIVR